MDLQNAGWRVKRSILSISRDKKTPHVSSALSCADILVALFSRKKASSLCEIYLSKGHAALALYCTLAEYGFITADELATYGGDGSIFEGHVNSKIPGVPLSTGSLGHALAFAAGRALADSVDRPLIEHWVILSDGELDEGSNWEALLLASQLGLHGLNVIIDRNGLQSLKETESTLALEPLAEKLSAFNWQVEEVNGHSLPEIDAALERAYHSSSPTCIIANTVKGYPLAEIMSEGVLYHYRPATEAHLELFDSMKAYGA
jgi:transketolase